MRSLASVCPETGKGGRGKGRRGTHASRSPHLVLFPRKWVHTFSDPYSLFRLGAKAAETTVSLRRPTTDTWLPLFHIVFGERFTCSQRAASSERPCHCRKRPLPQLQGTPHPPRVSVAMPMRDIPCKGTCSPRGLSWPASRTWCTVLGFSHRAACAGISSPLTATYYASWVYMALVYPCICCRAFLLFRPRGRCGRCCGVCPCVGFCVDMFSFVSGTA